MHLHISGDFDATTRARTFLFCLNSCCSVWGGAGFAFILPFPFMLAAMDLLAGATAAVGDVCCAGGSEISSEDSVDTTANFLVRSTGGLSSNESSDWTMCLLERLTDVLGVAWGFSEADR